MGNRRGEATFRLDPVAVLDSALDELGRQAWNALTIEERDAWLARLGEAPDTWKLAQALEVNNLLREGQRLPTPRPSGLSAWIKSLWEAAANMGSVGDA